MVVRYGFVNGDNVFSKQKIQYWLKTEKEIYWHAFLWYISQYVAISDFSENDITIEMHSIGDYDFFVETAKDYNDILWKQYYQLAISDCWWLTHKNPNLNREIIERLINMDKKKKDA